MSIYDKGYEFGPLQRSDDRDEVEVRVDEILTEDVTFNDLEEMFTDTQNMDIYGVEAVAADADNFIICKAVERLHEELKV